MRIKTIMASLSVAAVLSFPALAERDRAESALEFRQGAFNVIAWSFGPMAGMVKNKMPYDAALFSEHAERVAYLAKLPLEGFIADSKVGDTTAKQKVWDQPEEFKAQMDAMIREADKLVEVAKAGDLDAIRPQFGALGNTCKECHDDYRTE
ncbi:MAG: cytochrome c [Gammaproteobacteria bacterium]